MAKVRPLIRVRLTSALVLSTVAAALGGLLFGFDTAVIAGVTHNLVIVYGLSPLMLGLTVSSALWGTILGALFVRFPADRLGRKPTLLVLAGLYLLSALGCAFSWSWSALVCFRIIGGVAIGGSSVVGPMYIAEVSPPEWRGLLGGFFQFNVCGGVLLAYLSNFLISLLGLGATEWRWKLGIGGIPSLAFGLSVLVIHESPRWLITRGRDSDATRTLEKLSGASNEQLTELLHSVRSSLADTSRLFSRGHKLLLFVALSIGFFNQMSGVNAILYYLNDIFMHAGFDRISGNLQAIAVGSSNFIATILAMAVIDKLGRKRLLLIGAVGPAVCLTGVSAIFLNHINRNLLVWFLIGFIGFFSFSQGSVIWVYLSELFPNRVRAAGTSLGSFNVWLMTAIVSGIFPVIAARSFVLPFVLFSAMMWLQFVVVLVFYPETKGLALEQIQTAMAFPPPD